MPATDNDSMDPPRMTLRQHYAGLALPACIAAHGLGDADAVFEIAVDALRVADFLMKAEADTLAGFVNFMRPDYTEEDEA